MLLRPASEMTDAPVEWLWPGYLAVGSLAILDGDPGTGKSLLTLDLAARLTTARPWPDGAANPTSASVILLGFEDPENVVKARMTALGINMTRAFPWPRDGNPPLPRFPADLPLLEQVLKETSARLVIIDPIVAFLESAAANSDVNVRAALHPLALLAEQRHTAILLVRHLNKLNRGVALYRGAGSIGFVAACRLAWLTGHDPRMEERLVLAQAKNNLGPIQPSLTYALPTDAPRIDWQGPAPWLADDLAKRRPTPARRRARDFLRLFLEHGPRPASEIWPAAHEIGLSDATVKRARRDLKIRRQQCYADGKRNDHWLLAGQQMPAGPRSDTPDLDDWLRKWREMYPSRPDNADD
jgi:AAA domain